VTGGTLINVLTGEIYPADVAIAGSGIAAVGAVESMIGAATTRLDASGRYLTPGLIDAHLHTYETHLSVAHLAAAMLEHGVTAILTDFYGEAVVGGKDAIRAALDIAAELPFNVMWALPMPAYYQDLPFVHTGSLSAGDMREMLAWPECIGINECFASRVVGGDEVLLELMDRARGMRKVLCGHASEIRGSELMAWVAYGAQLDDHESVSAAEVVEKARLGVRIILREGSGVSDVRNCLPAITNAGVDSHRFCFCSDLLSPRDLQREGDIDRCVRYAMEAGIPAVDAVRMGSLNAAQTLGVDAWTGSIAPGKRADICLVASPLEDYQVTDVVSGGLVVVEGGRYTGPEPIVAYPDSARNTVRLGERPSASSFTVPTGATGTVNVRVIEVRDGSLITNERIEALSVVDGCIASDPARDILKVASFERHGKTGKRGLGFVAGYGIRRGAVASTYNPHCQHLLVIGADDDDMVVAADQVARMGGGFAVAADGEVVAAVPLPLYGLLSELSAPELVDQLETAITAIRGLGSTLSAPFHTLAFLGLPVVIGQLKICSEGLIDVWAGTPVSLEVSARSADI
jgi:adenine deaminase